MARYLVAAAGAAIGFLLLGGPAGLSLGWTAGMLIGGLLFPPDPIQGPRLDDRKVQISSYGVAIPKVWGWFRLGGNVIWATDLVERSNKEGGKGGPTQIVYTYFGNFTSLFCEGGQGAVRRIWGDGKLMWEAPSGTVATPGAGYLGSFGWNSKYSNYITIRFGLETQTASSLHETYDGVGNAPAYRGYVTVDFALLPLKDFGNRLPSISIEYFGGVAEDTCEAVVFDAPNPATDPTDIYVNGFYSIAGIMTDVTTRRMHTIMQRNDGGHDIITQSMDTLTEIARVAIILPDSTSIFYYGGTLNVPDSIGGDWVMARTTKDSPEQEENCMINWRTGAVVTIANQTIGAFGGDSGGFNTCDPKFGMELGGSSTKFISIWPTEWDWSTGGPETTLTSLAIVRHDIATGALDYLMYNDNGPAKTDVTHYGETFSRWTCPGRVEAGGSTFFVGMNKPNSGYPGVDYNGLRIYEFTVSSAGGVTWREVCNLAATVAPASTTVIWWGGWYDADTDRILACWRDGTFGNYVYGFARVRPSDGAVEQTLTDTEDVGLTGYGGPFGIDTYDYFSNYPDPEDGYAFLIDRTESFERSGALIMRIADLTWEIFYTRAVMVAKVDARSNTFVQYENAVYAEQECSAPENTKLSLAAPTNVSLASIVKEVCERCGMVDGTDFDVSALTTRVTGYMASRQATGRQLIEPLQTSDFFDGIETEGIIRWQYRGGSAVATIDENDLATVSEGGEPIPKISEVTQQEIELPFRVVVRYVSQEYDYESVTQQEFRSRATQFSELDKTVDMPIVMTPAKAKQVAIKTLYNAWQMRTSYQFTLPRKYIYLDPGDVVTVTADNVLYTVYVMDIERAGEGWLRIRGVSHDETLYLDGDEIGNAVAAFPQTPPRITDMVYEFLDGPLMIESFNTQSGFAVAAEGLDQSIKWDGGVLMRSPDGTNFIELASVPTEAIMGTASTTLLDASHNVLDEDNVVRVAVNRGVLASVTYAGLMNGANRAMLGDEVIGFATATQISAGVYDLSRLLRGIQGTEWASGTHVVGERFIVLDFDNVHGVPIDSSEVGLERTYRGVSIGQAVDDAPNVLFTPQNLHMKPLAPAQFTATRDGSNNIIFTWARRARINIEWHDDIDSPLDEGIEQYKLQIMDGASVKREIIIDDTSTYTYTIGDQTTDWAGAKDPVEAQIAQVSDRVGDGYFANRTV